MSDSTVNVDATHLSREEEGRSPHRGSESQSLEERLWGSTAATMPTLLPPRHGPELWNRTPHMQHFNRGLLEIMASDKTLGRWAKKMFRDVKVLRPIP